MFGPDLLAESSPPESAFALCAGDEQQQTDDQHKPAWDRSSCHGPSPSLALLFSLLALLSTPTLWSFVVLSRLLTIFFVSVCLHCGFPLEFVCKWACEWMRVFCCACPTACEPVLAWGLCPCALTRTHSHRRVLFVRENKPGLGWGVMGWREK